jgi:phospholipid/cholesterol/gamma-HCH transport system ATP-binding protein
MIRLVGIEKSFAGRQVLCGLDLEVPESGVTFVVGRSGAGKSVLSRCCVGLLRPDAGEIWIAGERIDLWPERALIELRCRVPYVVQGSGLIDWMDLMDNVAVPLVRALRLPRAEARERARAALAQVGLSELEQKRPPEMGPGARKRAAIARALALRPRAILYDEPTTGLDAAAARRVDRLIREAARAGTTALVVSHDLKSLELIADRVALLDQGVVGYLGGVGEFFRAQEEHPAVRRFFHQSEE